MRRREVCGIMRLIREPGEKETQRPTVGESESGESCPVAGIQSRDSQAPVSALRLLLIASFPLS